MFRLRMQTVSWLEAKLNKKGKNSKTIVKDLFTFFKNLHMFSLKALGRVISKTRAPGCLPSSLPLFPLLAT